jgi:thymidine phosphorylase
LYRLYAEFPSNYEFARDFVAKGSGYTIGEADLAPRYYVDF